MIESSILRKRFEIKIPIKLELSLPELNTKYPQELLQNKTRVLNRVYYGKSNDEVRVAKGNHLEYFIRDRSSKTLGSSSILDSRTWREREKKHHCWSACVSLAVNGIDTPSTRSKTNSEIDNGIIYNPVSRKIGR